MIGRKYVSTGKPTLTKKKFKPELRCLFLPNGEHVASFGVEPGEFSRVQLQSDRTKPFSTTTPPLI